MGRRVEVEVELVVGMGVAAGQGRPVVAVVAAVAGDTGVELEERHVGFGHVAAGLDVVVENQAAAVTVVVEVERQAVDTALCAGGLRGKLD